MRREEAPRYVVLGLQILRCRGIIVDVTIAWSATSEWNVDRVCEGSRREEEEGECELRQGKHGGEGRSYRGE